MRTSNPALNDSVFSVSNTGSEVMTLEGTAIKSLLLTMIVILCGAWAYDSSMSELVSLNPSVIEESGKLGTLSHVPSSIYTKVIGGALVGFVLGMIIIFNPKSAPILSFPYAIVEGISLGAFSTIFEYMYPGVVPVSIAITMGILFALLIVYSLGLIEATENFKLGVVAATGGICLFYLSAIVLGFFGIEMPMLHETGPMGIGLSLVIVVIASLNLVLDFDFIESGVNQGCPKYMEWYGAFGLLVTLVWLYLEVLKLMAKVMASSNDD